MNEILSQLGGAGIIGIAIWSGFRFMEKFPVAAKITAYGLAALTWLAVLYLGSLAFKEIFC